MLVEFIVCTVIGYNLYKNTACVAHISGSIYLTAQLILAATWTRVGWSGQSSECLFVIIVLCHLRMCARLKHTHAVLRRFHAYLSHGVSMTSIGSYCIGPPGLVNLWQARSPASIVHIAPSDPMTSRAQILAYVRPPLHLNPHNKKDLVSNPAWWEAQINIHTYWHGFDVQRAIILAMFLNWVFRPWQEWTGCFL